MSLHPLLNFQVGVELQAPSSVSIDVAGKGAAGEDSLMASRGGSPGSLGPISQHPALARERGSRGPQLDRG